MAAASRRVDVIVVGGGPAGSVLAWKLAVQGVRVIVLERARFPREKVCGDYVEPRGLRILREMGCLDELEASQRPSITHSATFVDWACRYRGPIPFYGLRDELPPHGYIVPREELDHVMLMAADRAGATIHQETAATSVEATGSGMEVDARRRGRTVRYRAPLVVGADGVNSIVAKAAGLLVDDPRYIAVAQRAYAGGFGGDAGEAVFCFDQRLFPGYGWVFPLGGGVVNVGVGLLSETRRRLNVHIPDLFDRFIEGLRRSHPGCERLELSSSPIGGIVKTYGGAGPNHFQGGVLIGDAGSFVDPMTGEGITPGMESALLAAPVLTGALEHGDFSAERLADYRSAFRAYFDPAMTFLDLCAATLRNRSMARPWLKALGRGCELAQTDRDFARTGGSYFGGLDVRPFGILAEIWIRIARELALAWPRQLASMLGGGVRAGPSLGDLLEWQAAWSRSALTDPLWHARWSMDVQRKWMRVLSAIGDGREDPRAKGLVDVIP
jgi:geranylgeranyl reductase family protein